MASKKQIDRREDFEKLLNVFKTGNDFILTTHKSCDPDGIGSELGLSYLLSKLEKKHSILNPDKMPDKYRFIDPQFKVRNIDPNILQNFTFDKTVVVVDNSDLPRIGDVNQFLKPDKSNLILIDHHDNIDPFAGLFSFPEIGSTSEIIYEIIELAGISLDYNTAIALYLGIVMDTGQFKYSKTRPRTHEIAAKLVQYNFPIEDLLRKMYEDFPISVLLLKKDIYSSIEIHQEYHLVTIEITKSMLGKYNFNSNPLEGITSELLGPSEIYVSVAFTEGEEDFVKISFRSKGDYDVCSVAKEFNGGGHKNASGAMIRGGLKKVKEDVMNRLISLLKI
ncbi:MAG: bifunctional oligoribonuclease/PAP phosphatase NrnA [Leptospiraceae bacterium]|nr:bifunctional oligoribonuclease/PAP phosphatase NrnA [Leptospiraceae bacterium]